MALFTALFLLSLVTVTIPLAQSLQPASPTLINIRANYVATDAPGCYVTPEGETTDSSGNTYAIGIFGNWLSTYNQMSSPLAAVNFGGTTLTQSNYSTSTIYIAKYGQPEPWPGPKPSVRLKV